MYSPEYLRWCWGGGGLQELQVGQRPWKCRGRLLREWDCGEVKPYDLRLDDVDCGQDRHGTCRHGAS